MDVGQVEQVVANRAVLVYLKGLPPERGSYHPDVYDFVKYDLPNRAGIKTPSVPINGRITLVHPESGVIVAFFQSEAIFGVRVPEVARGAAVQTVDKQGHSVTHLFPEVGEDWIRFPLFSMQEKSPGWLAEAYRYGAGVY